MGISYNAVAMYGKYFENRNELRAFVGDIYPDAEVDCDGIYEVPELSDIEIVCLNEYSGGDLLLGYRVTPGETLDAYQAKWSKAFPGVDAESFLEVRMS